MGWGSEKFIFGAHFFLLFMVDILIDDEVENSIKLPKNFQPVPFQYHEKVEIEITDITNLGMGVGRVGQWVVMVPYVCLGETVEVQIYQNYKNYSVGDLVKVLTKSPERIAPKCPLYGVCGGCQYQHMRYDEQRRLKQKQVKDGLMHIAGLPSVEVEECLSMAEHDYFYRSKITPHFQKGRPEIGFLKQGTRSLVDVPQCPIATSAINAILPAERQKIESLKSSMKRGGTLLLRDVGGKVETDNKKEVEQMVGNYRFRYYAGEFFQNNPYMLPLFAETVVQAAQGPRYLIDSYCGVGLFGIIGARYFQKVIGIEINKDAITLARKNAQLNGISSISFVAGTAERIFDEVTFPAEDTAMIMDPPRAGCDKLFLDQLMHYGPQKLIYVSCAPDTQARDIKWLLPMYEIVRIQPFDMFPQTRHIENMVVLQKRP